MAPTFPVTFFALLLCLVSWPCSTADSSYYTAAVFEHARVDSTRDPPHVIIANNLKFYQRATKIAKSKDADVIVFPEYGLFPETDRESLKPFLETIPDPTQIKANPCADGKYLSMPILRTLSCLATQYSMVVVANMGDIQKCNGNPRCPPDGVFQYNTNVVFDRDGTLLARYHKEHLFFEPGMDVPHEKQNPVFRLDFGTFATFVCFDIVYHNMSDYAQKPSIDGILFSTNWMDNSPQFRSVPFFQGWAIGNNITLVAANVQKPSQGSLGSGVFHARHGTLGYTFNPDNISKLLVSLVPKKRSSPLPSHTSITAVTANDTWDYVDDGKDVPDTCDNSMTESRYACRNEPLDKYKMAKLNKASGTVGACSNSMCCTVDYSTNGLKEDFYLGVFNGSFDALGRYGWCEEDCFLARCDGTMNDRCEKFHLRSNTVFNYAHLYANFTSKFVYPSVVSSGMRLVPQFEWHFEPPTKSISSLHFRSLVGQNLTSIGFKGRCYDKDPPYY